jgi:hypothetical protein
LYEEEFFLRSQQSLAISMHEDFFASHRRSMELSLTFMTSRIQCKAGMKSRREGRCSMREKEGEIIDV